MGGRGTSSAGGTSTGWTKDGVINTSGEVRHVERMTGWVAKLSEEPALVLEATTDGAGNLTLEYAEVTGYRKQNSKTTYAQYDISAGLTNRGATGKTTDIESHNINWDKVRSVSGKTYGTQSFMKSHGFKWDSANKRWVK